MIKQLCAGLLATVACASVAVAQHDNDVTLKVGDKAPSLKEVHWVKGEPIKEFESGQIYVLDFWATWCGPCVASIPHINELQAEYKDDGVNVIGVAIWPRAGMMPTAEFVEKRGDSMNYRIAEELDLETGKPFEKFLKAYVAEHGEGKEGQELRSFEASASQKFKGAIAESFMKAAGKNGIPTVMVIGKDGNLAWIGHPMSGLDRVIKMMVEGEFDAEQFAENQRKLDLRMESMMRRYRQAMQEEDWETVLTITDEFIEMDNEQFAGMNVTRYLAMVKMGKTKEAHALGMDLVENTMKDDADFLNALSWTIVEPGGEFEGKDRDLVVAMAAAQRADKLKGHEDPLVLDTLARVFFSKGDVIEAVKLQKKAVELSEGEGYENDLRKALKEYETALKSM